MTWNAEDEHLREVKKLRELSLRGGFRGGPRGGHLFILRRRHATRGPGE